MPFLLWFVILVLGLHFNVITADPGWERHLYFFFGGVFFMVSHWLTLAIKVKVIE